jgi:hypothetical protein
MSTIKVQASATGTGTVTLTAPVTNSDRTVTLPDQSGTLFMNSTNGALSVDAAAPTNSLTISSTGVIGGNGGSLTGLNASNLASGTVPDARFPATLPAASGANLTSLNAANISSGTVPTARLASGTANSSTFLRGDQSWATVTSLPGAQGQVFTGNGTFTIPSGITAVKVTVVGGGGGGCANQGGSGGGGGSAIKFLTGLTSGATLSVTVGGAGAGTAGTGAAGTGGTSSVASGTQSITTVSGSGGGGGVSQSGFNVYAAGGSGTNGDINISGTTGGGNALSLVICGFPAYWSSSAGSSILGLGAGIRQGLNGAPSVATSIGYGAGGQASMSGASGAAGTAGIVIFEW